MGLAMERRFTTRPVLVDPVTTEIVRALTALGLQVRKVSEGTPGDPGVHLHVVIPELIAVSN